MVESVLFIGAGAGAGEKNTRFRNQSKTDRLRTLLTNTIFFTEILFKNKRVLTSTQ